MRPMPLLPAWPLLVALMVAGCTAGPANEHAGDARNEAAGNASQPAAPPMPAKPASIHEKTGKIQFDYSWPQAAAAIPALDTWLRNNAKRLLAETLDNGRADEAAAKKAGYPFRGHTYKEDWGVVADLPALLVMQSEGYVFTGGAHGMPIVTTLIWDKARGQRLPLDALVDVAALAKQLNDPFCAALDTERAKRRGEPINAGDSNELSDFVRCVDPAKQTILPISRKGQALDTIRFVIMPYEAGPYAEGIYQLDLPVDGSVMQVVKPAYRNAFVGP